VRTPYLRALAIAFAVAIGGSASLPAHAGLLDFLQERFAPKPPASKAPKKVTSNKPVAKAPSKPEGDRRLAVGSVASAIGTPALGELAQTPTPSGDEVQSSSLNSATSEPAATSTELSNSVIGKVQVMRPEGLLDSPPKASLLPNDNGALSHFSGPIVFLAQSAEKTKVEDSPNPAPPSAAPKMPTSTQPSNVSPAPPNMVNETQASAVSFNAWAKQKAASDLVDNMPDPQRDNDATWTKMEVSPDLPPRVAILGEDLIGVVTKQLPAERAKRLAMPYDEFKLRVRDAVLAFPDVGAAQSQLGFAQAGVSESRAPLLPQINGFTESGKRSVGSDSYLGTPAYSRDGTNYGLSVRQVLFDFGAALFGFQSGKAKELAAQELLNSKRSEQALKTVASVIDLERARAQMNLATDNASSRLAIVKLVRERYEVGGGSKPDIIRAEARYAESLATVTNAQNRLKAAEAAYREAFAANPIGIIRGPNFEVPVEKLDATAEELAGTYPGLLQLAQLRDSAGAEAKSAFAKTLPSFNVVYDNIVNGVSAPLAPSRTVNLLLQLKYSFYTGGAESARKDQADFKAKQAEQEFQSGLRQYERVLTQNQEDVRNSDALLAARKVAATSAISSMRAVREQFAFNKGTLLDLLTVQEGLFNAGRDLVDAEADRQISRYRYLHLTSGLDRLFDLSDAAYDVRSEARSQARGEVRK
jgi:adhesin transport system outer membrane protein